jgi:hypothetical protein
MRFIAIAIVGLCVVTAALAQEEAPTATNWQPEWEALPSARDFARAYPPGAIADRTPGTVHLCCTPRDNGSLDCRSAFEWPQEQGFAQATLRAARAFRLTPASLAAYRADPNAVLHIPIVYSSSRLRPEYAEALQRIESATHGICAPEGADRGPLLEPIVVTIG